MYTYTYIYVHVHRYIYLIIETHNSVHAIVWHPKTRPLLRCKAQIHKVYVSAFLWLFPLRWFLHVVNIYPVQVPTQPPGSAVCGAECFLSAGAALDSRHGMATVHMILTQNQFNRSWMSPGTSSITDIINQCCIIYPFVFYRRAWSCVAFVAACNARQDNNHWQSAPHSQQSRMGAAIASTSHTCL